MKIVQKLRQRPNGVNVAELALGEKLTNDVLTASSTIYDFSPKVLSEYNNFHLIHSPIRSMSRLAEWST